MLVYFRNYAIVGHIISKCFLPFFKLSFYFVSFCMVSFAVQKILHLIWFHLFIFAFVCIILEYCYNLHHVKEGTGYVQFSQHHLLKRLLFPIVYCCLLCHSLIEYRYVGLFLAFPVKKEFLGPGLHLRPVCADCARPPLQWTLNSVLSPCGKDNGRIRPPLGRGILKIKSRLRENRH